jgi:hypothetical protein
MKKSPITEYNDDLQVFTTFWCFKQQLPLSIDDLESSQTVKRFCCTSPNHRLSPVAPFQGFHENMPSIVGELPSEIGNLTHLEGL